MPYNILKIMLSSVNSIILSKMWTLIVSLFVQLVVTSMQQIFGDLNCMVYIIVHSITRYAKLMQNSIWCRNVLFFLFLTVTWLQCPIKALNVTYGNSFSNQWAFTLLRSEVFKYNFLNFYITKNMLSILWNLYSWC